ncbi:hypothetical protein F4819DRAFT_491655 [Hypoxylon fuscum]|nr:hypothetical protein F4819DRAFT_491655 [Hypoxylon fuscum]
MKFLGLISLALLAATANARCYGDNDSKKITDQEEAYAAASDACTEFKGNYGRYQAKQKCVAGADGSKYSFIVARLKNGNRTIEQDECFDGLRKEIHGCERGGYSRYKNWSYDVRYKIPFGC